MGCGRDFGVALALIGSGDGLWRVFEADAAVGRGWHNGWHCAKEEVLRAWELQKMAEVRD